MRSRGATDVADAEIATLKRVLQIVSVAAIVGLLALVATIGSALQQRGDTQAQIQRNTQLIESVRRLEEITADSVDDHRHRNEVLHGCIVDLIMAIVNTERPAGEPIGNPCPDELSESETNG